MARGKRKRGTPASRKAAAQKSLATRKANQAAAAAAAAAEEAAAAAAAATAEESKGGSAEESKESEEESKESEEAPVSPKSSSDEEPGVAPPATGSDDDAQSSDGEPVVEEDHAESGEEGAEEGQADSEQAVSDSSPEVDEDEFYSAVAEDKDVEALRLASWKSHEERRAANAEVEAAKEQLATAQVAFDACPVPAGRKQSPARTAAVDARAAAKSELEKAQAALTAAETRAEELEEATSTATTEWRETRWRKLIELSAKAAAKAASDGAAMETVQDQLKQAEANLKADPAAQDLLLARDESQIVLDDAAEVALASAESSDQLAANIEKASQCLLRDLTEHTIPADKIAEDQRTGRQQHIAAQALICKAKVLTQPRTLPKAERAIGELSLKLKPLDEAAAASLSAAKEAAAQAQAELDAAQQAKTAAAEAADVAAVKAQEAIEAHSKSKSKNKARLAKKLEAANTESKVAAEKAATAALRTQAAAVAAEEAAVKLQQAERAMLQRQAKQARYLLNVGADLQLSPSFVFLTPPASELLEEVVFDRSLDAEVAWLKADAEDKTKADEDRFEAEVFSEAELARMQQRLRAGVIQQAIHTADLDYAKDARAEAARKELTRMLKALFNCNALAAMYADQERRRTCTEIAAYRLAENSLKQATDFARKLGEDYLPRCKAAAEAAPEDKTKQRRVFSHQIGLELAQKATAALETHLNSIPSPPALGSDAEAGIPIASPLFRRRRTETREAIVLALKLQDSALERLTALKEAALKEVAPLDESKTAELEQATKEAEEAMVATFRAEAAHALALAVPRFDDAPADIVRDVHAKLAAVKKVLTAAESELETAVKTDPTYLKPDTKRLRKRVTTAKFIKEDYERRFFVARDALKELKAKELSDAHAAWTKRRQAELHVATAKSHLVFAEKDLVEAKAKGADADADAVLCLEELCRASRWAVDYATAQLAQCPDAPEVLMPLSPEGAERVIKKAMEKRDTARRDFEAKAKVTGECVVAATKDPSPATQDKLRLAREEVAAALMLVLAFEASVQLEQEDKPPSLLIQLERAHEDAITEWSRIESKVKEQEDEVTELEKALKEAASEEEESAAQAALQEATERLHRLEAAEAGAEAMKILAAEQVDLFEEADEFKEKFKLVVDSPRIRSEVHEAEVAAAQSHHSSLAAQLIADQREAEAAKLKKKPVGAGKADETRFKTQCTAADKAADKARKEANAAVSRDAERQKLFRTAADELQRLEKAEADIKPFRKKLRDAITIADASVDTALRVKGPLNINDDPLIADSLDEVVQYFRVRLQQLHELAALLELSKFDHQDAQEEEGLAEAKAKVQHAKSGLNCASAEQAQAAFDFFSNHLDDPFAKKAAFDLTKRTVHNSAVLDVAQRALDALEHPPENENALQAIASVSGHYLPSQMSADGQLTYQQEHEQQLNALTNLHQLSELGAESKVIYSEEGAAVLWSDLKREGITDYAQFTELARQNLPQAALAISGVNIHQVVHAHRRRVSHQSAIDHLCDLILGLREHMCDYGGDKVCTKAEFEAWANSPGCHQCLEAYTKSLRTTKTDDHQELPLLAIEEPAEEAQGGSRKKKSKPRKGKTIGPAVQLAHWLFGLSFTPSLAWVQAFLANMNFTNAVQAWIRTGNTFIFMTTLPFVAALEDAGITTALIGKGITKFMQCPSTSLIKIVSQRSNVSKEDTEAYRQLTAEVQQRHDSCLLDFAKSMAKLDEFVGCRDNIDELVQQCETTGTPLNVKEAAKLLKNAGQRRRIKSIAAPNQPAGESSPHKKKASKKKEAEVPQREVLARDAKGRPVHYTGETAQDELIDAAALVEELHDEGDEEPAYESDGEVKDDRNESLPVSPAYQQMSDLAKKKHDAKPSDFMESVQLQPFVSSRQVHRQSGVRFGVRQSIGPSFLGTKPGDESIVPVCVKTVDRNFGESTEPEALKAARRTRLERQRREIVASEWFRNSMSSKLYGATSFLPRFFGHVLDDCGHDGHVFASYAEEWLVAAQPLAVLLNSKHDFHRLLASPAQDFRHAVLHAQDEDEDDTEHEDEAKAIESRVMLAKQTAAAVAECHKRGVRHGLVKPEHIMVTSEHTYKQTCLGGCLPRVGIQAERDLPPGGSKFWYGSVNLVPPEARRVRACQLPHAMKAEGRLLDPDFCNLFDPVKPDRNLLKEMKTNRAARSRVTIVDFKHSFLGDPHEPCPPVDEGDLKFGQQGFQFLPSELNHWLMDDVFDEVRDEQQREDAPAVEAFDSLETPFPTFLHPIALHMVTDGEVQTAGSMGKEIDAREQAVTDAEAKVAGAKDDPELKATAKEEVKAAMLRLKQLQQLSAVEFALKPESGTAKAIVDNFPLFEVVKQIFFGYAHEFTTVCATEPAADEAPLAVQHFASFVEKALSLQAAWHPSWHQFLMQATIAGEVTDPMRAADDSVMESFRFTLPPYPAEFVKGTQLYRRICTRHPKAAQMMHKLSAMRASANTEAYYGWRVDLVNDVPAAYAKGLKESLEAAVEDEQKLKHKIQDQLASKSLRRQYDHTHYHSTTLDSLLDSLQFMISSQPDEDGESRELTAFGEKLQNTDMLQAILMVDQSDRRDAMCKQLGRQILEHRKEYFQDKLALVSKPTKKEFGKEIAQGHWLSAWRLLADSLFVEWKKKADQQVEQLKEAKLPDTQDAAHRKHYRRLEDETRIQLVHMVAQAAADSLAATLEIVAAANELKFKATTPDDESDDEKKKETLHLLLLPGGTDHYVFEGTQQDAGASGPPDKQRKNEEEDGEENAAEEEEEEAEKKSEEDDQEEAQEEQKERNRSMREAAAREVAAEKERNRSMREAAAEEERKSAVTPSKKRGRSDDSGDEDDEHRSVSDAGSAADSSASPHKKKRPSLRVQIPEDAAAAAAPVTPVAVTSAGGKKKRKSTAVAELEDEQKEEVAVKRPRKEKAAAAATIPTEKKKRKSDAATDKSKEETSSKRARKTSAAAAAAAR